MTGEEFLAWVDANREFINMKTEIFILADSDHGGHFEAYEIFVDGEGDVVIRGS